MHIFKTIAELQPFLAECRQAGKSIGFAPTMGALHTGHLSLIQKAQQDCDVTICSIFVNPTQFNDPADLTRYPRAVERDTEMLEAANCTALFLPDVTEIYPDGVKWHNPYHFGALFEVMEGAHRPGHFDGMVQVVKRLLDIVEPDRIYMGQKDYQQQTIIKHLLALMHSKTVLVCCPIKRERDGLAMSSRNVRLTPDDRSLAPYLFQTLRYAQADTHDGYTPQEVRTRAVARIAAMPAFSLDYFEVVDGETLLPLNDWHDTTADAVACVTVRLGGVRLLDNIILRLGGMP